MKEDFEKAEFEKEKFEILKAELTDLLIKSGYTGTFPDFTKEEKYIRFGISYLNYENENGEFFYDLSAAFGKGGKRCVEYRNIVNDDKLSLPALSLADDEREEKLAMYVKSIDLILDGKRPNDEFLALDGIRMSNVFSPSIIRMGSVMLIIFAVVFAVLGIYWNKTSFAVAAVLALSGVYLLTNAGHQRILRPCKKEKK